MNSNVFTIIIRRGALVGYHNAAIVGIKGSDKVDLVCHDKSGSSSRMNSYVSCNPHYLEAAGKHIV